MISRLCNFACYSIRRFNPFWRSCMSVSRRDFLTGAVVGSLSLGSQGQDRKEREPKSPPVAQAGGKRPIIVCAGNGYDYLGDAYKFLSSGGDTLDAALRVVKGPEDDPKDDSVGLAVFLIKKAWSKLMAAANIGLRPRQGPWAEDGISRMVCLF